MNNQVRPSHKELSKKLREAQEVLSQKDGFFAEPSKNLCELDKLHLEIEDFWSFIFKILSEIHPENYTGSRPPQKAYETKIIGSELFAFSWTSSFFKKKMYLKFVLRNNNFYLVSLHEDKPIKKGVI